MTNAAAAPAGTPAPYATLADVYAAGCDRLVEQDDALTKHLQIATDVLFQLTGRQYSGPVTETLRPCCGAWLCDAWSRSGYAYQPDIVAGQWYNFPGSLGGPCLAYECGIPLARLDTGVWPVTEATVKIDGADFAAFRIDDNRYLTRTDAGLWPTAQDVRKADTQPGTWSVTLTYGRPLPASLVNATAVLACELTKHAAGSDDCTIPLNVTSMNRAGSSYTLANVQQLLDQGRTGIYVVDLAILSLNPNRQQRRPRVVSPDVKPRAYRV